MLTFNFLLSLLVHTLLQSLLVGNLVGDDAGDVVKVVSEYSLVVKGEEGAFEGQGGSCLGVGRLFEAHDVVGQLGQSHWDSTDQKLHLFPVFEAEVLQEASVEFMPGLEVRVLLLDEDGVEQVEDDPGVAHQVLDIEVHLALVRHVEVLLYRYSQSVHVLQVARVVGRLLWHSQLCLQFGGDEEEHAWGEERRSLVTLGQEDVETGEDFEFMGVGGEAVEGLE